MYQLNLPTTLVSSLVYLVLFKLGHAPTYSEQTIVRVYISSRPTTAQKSKNISLNSTQYAHHQV